MIWMLVFLAMLSALSGAFIMFMLMRKKYSAPHLHQSNDSNTSQIEALTELSQTPTPQAPCLIQERALQRLCSALTEEFGESVNCSLLMNARQIDPALPDVILDMVFVDPKTTQPKLVLLIIKENVFDDCGSGAIHKLVAGLQILTIEVLKVPLSVAYPIEQIQQEVSMKLFPDSPF